MSKQKKKQPEQPITLQETEAEFDDQNLLAFFRLLLQVDKRLNPKTYEVRTND